MDWSSPDTWCWIWLVTAVVFAVGEMAVAGSFFLAPFALGAAVAAVLGFLGVPLAVEWAAFLVVSLGAFAALRPLAKKLDQAGPHLGVGSHRQIGQVARVIEAIDGAEDEGLVMLGAERWRAESADGQVFPVGATVSVVEVRGTKLLVRADVGRPTPARPDPAAG
ncbi:NfeD family protein [Aquihabitans sp. G128]|uniref:NfeD family protein n=1 Tax=Aquihabitans sp. G128 TaxID=2849779 RepID=UPI001C21275B|nr:NfeD family protein [Aquihabitans sp. G128]QXC61447.1 NfeD family protein [Aquihabitans sp. G128]